MSSPLRICHFAASRGLGRGEVYVDLANAMARSSQNLEVGLLVPAHARFRERVDPGVRLLEYHARNARHNPLLWLELAALIRRFSPALVHTHFAKATAIYRGLNAFLRIPFVATKHNPRRGKVFEKVDNVIAVSRVVQDSVKSGRAIVIYNGLTAESPAAQATTGDGALKLLCVGRLDPIKGYDLLLRALAGFELPWELTLLGEGDQRDHLESLVAGLGLSTRVHLPGFRDDIPQQMAACHACIFSSKSEGCSIAMLEAMHYAPLVLSTRTGLAAELFPDWLLWDLDDTESLFAALTDYPARRARFTAWAASARAEFSMTRVVDRHLELYRRIVVSRT